MSNDISAEEGVSVRTADSPPRDSTPLELDELIRQMLSHLGENPDRE